MEDKLTNPPTPDRLELRNQILAFITQVSALIHNATEFDVSVNVARANGDMDALELIYDAGDCTSGLYLPLWNKALFLLALLRQGNCTAVDDFVSEKLAELQGELSE